MTKKTPDPAGTAKDAADRPADNAEPPGGTEPRAGGGAPEHEPLSETDALRSAGGESVDRQDAARSMTILSEKLLQLQRLLVESGPGVVNVYAPARDMNVGWGGSTPAAADRCARIDPGHLADYTGAYVQPPAFGDCLDILSERNLLVLSGTGGTGREATALALLDKLVATGPEADGPPVYSLPLDDVADDLWRVPATGTGYLTIAGNDRHGTARLLESLDDAWLTRVSQALRDAGSFLVLVTGPLRGRLTEATRRRAFVLEGFTAPDPMEVLRARVLAGVPDLGPEDVELRLAEAGAPELLAVRPSPRFATIVASTTVTTLTAGGDLVAALARLDDPAEQAREWFAHHEEPEHISLALAAAVLEGSSYLTVSDAAVELYTALSPGPIRVGPDLVLPPTPRALRLRRTMPAEQPWLELVPSETGPPSVRFRDRRSQAAVLNYAWTELDGMRPTLLDWLGRLVAHPDVEVRARAAFAVGLLAAPDLQHAEHRYLRQWSLDDSPVLRNGAALALSVIATMPQHTARVWQILREFADSARNGRNVNAAATAAMAATGPLGAKEPARALRLLRSLFRDGGWELLDSAFTAVMQLLQNGRGTEVVQALMDWTDSDDNDPLAVKGLATFAIVVREPAAAPESAEDGRDDGDADVTRLPLLLTAAADHRDELPELWGRALASGKVRRLALASLRDWMRLTDQTPALEPTVLDVLAGVADRGDRDMRRLEYYLDLWAEDEDDPSPAAGRVLDALLAAS
ncbi:MAG TPA: hypothetical protein VGD67_04380 [Pseudonocardiaceae bacterium]